MGGEAVGLYRALLRYGRSLRWTDVDVWKPRLRREFRLDYPTQASRQDALDVPSPALPFPGFTSQCPALQRAREVLRRRRLL